MHPLSLACLEAFSTSLSEHCSWLLHLLSHSSRRLFCLLMLQRCVGWWQVCQDSFRSPKDPREYLTSPRGCYQARHRPHWWQQRSARFERCSAVLPDTAGLTFTSTQTYHAHPAHKQQNLHQAQDCFSVLNSCHRSSSNKVLVVGQQPATQKKQDPSQGKTVSEGDPKKAPLYTTASAAWNGGQVSQGMHNSPALAKGPWGQSRGFFSGAVLGYVKDMQNKSDRGSDVGGVLETGRTSSHCCHDSLLKKE